MVFKGKEEKFFPSSLEKALNTLFSIDNGALYFNEESVISAIPDSKLCDINVVWRNTAPGYISFGLKKDSPFYELFKMQTMKLFNTGSLKLLVNTWLKKDFTSSCEKQRNVSPESKSLGYEKLVSLFIIIAAGFLLAVIVMIIEKLCNIKINNGSVQKSRKPNDNMMKVYEKDLDSLIIELVGKIITKSSKGDSNMTKNNDNYSYKKLKLIKTINEVLNEN